MTEHIRFIAIQRQRGVAILTGESLVVEIVSDKLYKSELGAVESANRYVNDQSAQREPGYALIANLGHMRRVDEDEFDFVERMMLLFTCEVMRLRPNKPLAEASRLELAPADFERLARVHSAWSNLRPWLRDRTVDEELAARERRTLGSGATYLGIVTERALDEAVRDVLAKHEGKPVTP